MADALIAETLADPGIVEVGYRDGMRFSITLEERSAEDGRTGMELGGDTVFVITGAAGGITSAITADLAADADRATVEDLFLDDEDDCLPAVVMHSRPGNQ